MQPMHFGIVMHTTELPSKSKAMHQESRDALGASLLNQAVLWRIMIQSTHNLHWP